MLLVAALTGCGSARTGPAPSDASIDAPPDAPRDAGLDAPREPSCAVDAGPIAPSCDVVDPTSFGDCGERIGAAFDGTTCVEVTGCPCDGGRCTPFGTVEECARDCAAAGRCRIDVLSDLSYAGGDHCGFCDRLGLCFDATDDPTSRVEPVMPRSTPTCAPGGGTDPFRCRDETWECVLRNHEGSGVTFVDPPEHQEICAASLLPGFVGWYCGIYL